MAKIRLTREDFNYINRVAEDCGTSDRFWDRVLAGGLHGKYINEFIEELEVEDSKENRQLILDCFLSGDIPNDEYFK